MQSPTLFLVALAALTAACSSTQGSPSDAGVTGDSGLSNVPYWQWYYPDCGAPGVCDHPGCSPTTLFVGPVEACGDTNKMVTTGCVPSLPTGGDSLYATSGHQLILSTESYPYTLDDLTACVEDGVLPPPNSHCCTWIDGGGPTTMMLFGGQ